MTERIPHIYSYTSAGNTGRPVHPMCELMSAASWLGLYVASKITSSGGISGNKSRTGTQAHGLTPPATPSAAVGAEQPELPKFPEGVEFCSAMEGQAKAWMSIWEWCCNNGMTMGSAGNMNGPQLIANWILELKKHPAAVGADRPGDGDHKEWCDGAKEFCERQVESDTVPRAEYDRVVKLNHHLREVAVMAIVERVPSDTEASDWKRRQKIRKATKEYSENTTPVSDSTPTNCEESEDTPPRGNDVPATDKPFRLEYGKRYVRDDGNVTDPLERTAPESQKGVTHPFRCPKYDITYDEDGSHVAGEQCPCNLVAEHHEPEPSTPAESPDVSGEIRGLKYALEWIDAKRAGNPKLKAAAWEMLNDMQVAYDAAIARLQDGEAINSTSQTDASAESPDDWVEIDDPEHVIRDCDRLSLDSVTWHVPVASIGTPIGEYQDLKFRCRRRDLPPVTIKSSDDRDRCDVCQNWNSVNTGTQAGHGVGECKVKHDFVWANDWCDQFAAHPDRYVLPGRAGNRKDLPVMPVVPKTRTVTLREYIMNGKSYWTTSDAEIGYTERTAVTEVPE